jgi:Protein of unknown function (DUF1631)
VSETDNQSGDVEEQPRYYIELVEQILTELESFFSSHLDEMFKQADEYLFKAAEEADNTAEQNIQFECMSSVRANQPIIQQSFVDELGTYLQAVSELEELPEKKQQKDKTLSLGLVEQNEMDEMVTLTTISSKAAMDNSEAINHLTLRLNELAQYNDHIFHGEALEPKRLCDAIHEAVSKTDLIDGNKLIVYRFFNDALVKKLVNLYGKLNDLLIANDILPVIDYTATMTHHEPMHQEAPAFDEEEQQSDPQGGGQHPPSGRRSFGSGMQGYSSAGGAVPMQGGAPAGGPPPNMSAPPGGQGAPVGGGGPRRAFGSGIQGYSQQVPSAPGSQDMGPSGQAYSAGVPVGQVRQSIENFVGGTSADVSSGGEGYYSPQQVMTALTDMQAPAGDLSQTPLVFDANQIKKAVLASIGEADGGAVTKAVHQVSEKTIDFIKLIFDGIIEEESITDEIKTLLLSLQIPVIKAAMLDAEFFVDDQHPARQLLDKIAEAGVGVSEHKDPVYVSIETIVRKLLNDYDEDVVAFTVALSELNDLTEEIYRNARETEVESQKAVKLAHAKSVVLQEIRKITIGKELPEGIRTLVLKIWPSMMFNHFLKNGKANDEWVELLMILQKIIESVQPLQSVSDLEELRSIYTTIVDAARTKLGACKKKQEIIDQAIKGLQQTYESLLITEDLPEESELEAVEDTATESVQADFEEDEGFELDHDEAKAEPEAEPETELTTEEIARAKITMLPDGVSPGAWFIVYNGEDKPVRRLKLAVILMLDATMVFVDHLGNVVIEKDAEIFADEIEKGLSGVIMQHSVFDHALSSALSSIEH